MDHIWDKVSENFALAASDYRLRWFGRVERLFKASGRLDAMPAPESPASPSRLSPSGMRFLEFVVRAVLLFAVVFVVWLSVYGVASAFGTDDPEGVANNGILVAGAMWAGVAFWRSRRTQRNT